MYVPIYGLYGTDGVMHRKTFPAKSHRRWQLMIPSGRRDEERFSRRPRKVPSNQSLAPADLAQRVMVWSMVWAGVTAWLSAIVMCFTVGPDWETYLEATSSYVVSSGTICGRLKALTAFQAWFMDVLDSTYGGGIWCAVMMMGLNVSDPQHLRDRADIE